MITTIIIVVAIVVAVLTIIFGGIIYQKVDNLLFTFIISVRDGQNSVPPSNCIVFY